MELFSSKQSLSRMWNRVTPSLAMHVIEKQTHHLTITMNGWVARWLVANEYQPEHSSLGTDVSHQSRGVSGLVAGEHQLRANPLVTGDHQGAANEDLFQEKLQMFDPSSLSTSDDFTFETHKVITQHLQTHFHLSFH